MDLGEILFKKFVYWREKKKAEVEDSQAIFLDEIKARLTLIARALCNASIEIMPAIGEGGWKEPYFYLPEKMNLFSSLELNFQYYIFRIFFLSKQRELSLNWTTHSEIGLEASRKAALNNASQVLKALSGEFEYFMPLYQKLKQADIESHWLYGKWMKPDMTLGANELNDINDVTGKTNGQDITTEINAKPVEEMTTIQVDREQQEEYMLTHNFEKIETAEEFDDVWRDFDGADHLEDDMHALNDLNLKHTVRVDDVVHSIYKADFSGQLTIAESKHLKESGFFYTYPEWNTKTRQYRHEFCRVYPLLFKSIKNQYALEVIRRNKKNIFSLKKNLAQFFNASAQIKRVNHGNLFDLDQVIDMYADIHAGVTPNENIYTSKRKRKKELSILFLIDLSLSGDSYVAGQRVIDIEKQAVLILGEVFSEFDIEFQIDGFFSKTRNFCNYITLKHFKQKWKNAMTNVGAISPQGFTRIGPAIRHAGFLLSKRETKAKWVILLSDGKPNDYDRYEGKYGIEDIKHAIQELKQKHIESYAIAIEEQAKYYLPQMFGVNHYNILSSPDALPFTVMKLYSKIALNRG